MEPGFENKKVDTVVCYCLEGALQLRHDIWILLVIVAQVLKKRKKLRKQGQRRSKDRNASVEADDGRLESKDYDEETTNLIKVLISIHSSTRIQALI